MVVVGGGSQKCHETFDWGWGERERQRQRQRDRQKQREIETDKQRETESIGFSLFSLGRKGLRKKTEECCKQIQGQDKGWVSIRTISICITP